MKLPLRLAVTGHRDIPAGAEKRLLEALGRALDDLQASYPDTRVELLSSLAEGADRLVARFVLSRGCGLVAVLPLAKEDYAEDFRTPASKAEFEELLSAAADSVVLPPPEGGDGSREERYEAAGIFLLKHSQILFALWDGKDAGKRGGTSEIVKFCLNGVPASCGPAGKRLLVPRDSGIVYHFPTERESVREAAEEYRCDLSCLVSRRDGYAVLYPEMWKSEDAKEAERKAAAFYAGVFAGIDGFNRDAKAIEVEDPEALKRNRSYLLPEEKEASLAPGRRELLEVYAAADTLAQKYQKASYAVLKGLLFFGVFTFFWVGFFDEFVNIAWVLCLIPVSFAAAVLLYRRSAGRGDENKFLDYRALAEGLRVQFFWKTVPLADNAYDHYLRKFRGEIDWIIEALKSASLVSEIADLKAAASGGRSPGQGEDFGLAGKHWIEDQAKYFAMSSARRDEALDKQGRRSTFCFVFGFLLVVVLFFLKLAEDAATTDLLEAVRTWAYHATLVGIDLSFTIGAAFSGYAEKRQFEGELKQFQRMASLYGRGLETFSGALKREDRDLLREVVVELGKEALAENGDWVILRRSHPLEVPQG